MIKQPQSPTQSHHFPAASTPSTLNAPSRHTSEARLTQPSPSATPPDPAKRRLLHDIARPLHTGIEGAFANDWLRAAFVEALVSDERLPDVVTTEHDLTLMLRGHQWEVDDALADRLHVFTALEDSIEHLEAKADDIRAGHTAPTTVWITTPGDHTDVMYQTIEYWADLDLIALLRGHWPHGPNRRPHPAEWSAADAQQFAVRPVQEALTALQLPR
ncbi:hypothetical protein [Actinomadura gamaensis]|uniref:Uncharacterized protein n=1 Tax=Actinomadura gamaensis TaxID=1763541 RepID=A0ABV9TTN3_9ACTN